MERKIEIPLRQRRKLHEKVESMTSKEITLSDECGNKSGSKTQPSARKLAATLWKGWFSEVEEMDNKLKGHNLSHAQCCSPAMECVTKWDTCPYPSQESNENCTVCALKKTSDEGDPYVAPILSSLQSELTQAKTRIQALEAEKQCLRKKTESFVRRVTEEEALWRSREHNKIRAAITSLKSELCREKKARQRLDLTKSKLAAELSSMKSSMKRLLQDYDNERKGKEMMEQVCDELAKEMGDDKAEIQAIKRDSARLREEMEEERKMVQMAELWREEQVQMKLVDARVILHQKYDRVSQLIHNMESFLESRTLNSTEAAREAELLLRTASSVTAQSTKEFSYQPPSTEEMLSALEHACLGHISEKEKTEPPHPIPTPRADRILMTAQGRRNCNEDGGRIGSAGGNVSGRSSSVSGKGLENGTEACETNAAGQSKKGALSRMWKAGRQGRSGAVNGRLSDSSTASMERSGVENGRVGLGSPETGNQSVNKVMKGCIEWPCNAHRSSSKVKLLGMGAEMQKMQLKHGLNQKV